jgi:hypothetical protein
MKRSLLVFLSLCVVFTFAAAMFAADATTVNGYVNDAACGAKNKMNAQCAKKCIAKGAKMVVVTDGEDKVLTVDNPGALEGHEGQHVAVTGKVKGDSIHVDSMNLL